MKKGRKIVNNMLEVMLELKGAEPLFIISRSHCAGASDAVFAMAVGLPEDHKIALHWKVIS